MSAFASLILLIFIAVASMGLVAFANYKVEQDKKVRQRLHRYKAQVEELEDIVLALDQVCQTRTIPKLVNDETVEIYEQMMLLDSDAGYLKASHTNAKMRSEELSDETAERQISCLCGSDAQIARVRAYLNAASAALKKQHNEGKISPTELQDLITELEWLHLQVYVISNVAEGHKAYNRQDILTANAFYKKAQSELMTSGHPDPRRHKMIKQLADILFGRRKSLDKELMPDDEFNPENNVQPSPTLSENDKKVLEEIMQSDEFDEMEAKAMAEALISQQQAQKPSSTGDSAQPQ